MSQQDPLQRPIVAQSQIIEGRSLASSVPVYTQGGLIWDWLASKEPIYREEDLPVKMTVLECWQYADLESEPRTEVAYITEDLIEAWLEKSYPLLNNERPVSGFKIVQINYRICNYIPLRRETLKAIHRKFELPPVEKHWASQNQGACGMFKEKNGTYTLLQSRLNIQGLRSSVLRFDPRTNLSYGYILTNEPCQPGNSARNIPAQFIQCSHPLLIPVLMIEADLKFCLALVVEVDMALKHVEDITGFSTTGSRDIDPPTLTSNYYPFMKKLGQQHSNCAAIEAILASLQVAVRVLRQKVKQLDDENREGGIDFNHSCSLHERLDFLSSHLEYACILYGNFQKRLQAQQSVLLSLIAQVDTQISIQLAKDSKELAHASKQDSSAMKIIAVLTTLFLPGTFLATFFAMPLLDWTSPSINNIAGPYFWIYWVVTGPVTLLTACLVLLWSWWHMRKNQSFYSRARASVDGQKLSVSD